ncbi:hypothetical protein HC766_06435 [Candidatus Gracilibacteria bacterium]|nr:hypothetical protein [Candidatus Gracilibacteria bacterium]
MGLNWVVRSRNWGVIPVWFGEKSSQTFEILQDSIALILLEHRSTINKIY